MKPIQIVKSPCEDIVWNKPMWLKHKDEDIIVLSTGQHSGISFEGTALPCEDYQKGDYTKSWNKSRFKPIDTPLTIIISN